MIFHISIGKKSWKEILYQNNEWLFDLGKIRGDNFFFPFSIFILQIFSNVTVLFLLFYKF